MNVRSSVRARSVLPVVAGSTGAALLGTAVVGRELVRRAEARFPPSGQLVETQLDGEPIRLHLRRSGQPGRPTVVLVHGMYGCACTWSPAIVDELATDHDVIAVDRPGHGWSDPIATPATPSRQARAIAAALRTLGIDRAMVVGHSWGGALSVAWALDAADIVGLDGLVLVAGYLMPSDLHIHAFYKIPPRPVIGPYFLDAVVPTLGRALTFFGARNAYHPAAVPDHVRPCLGLIPRGRQFAANAEDVRLLNPCLDVLAPRFATIDCPIELIAGDADQTLSSTHHSGRFAEINARAEMTLIAGGTHVLLDTHPQEIVGAVRRIGSSRR